MRALIVARRRWEDCGDRACERGTSFVGACRQTPTGLRGRVSRRRPLCVRRRPAPRCSGKKKTHALQQRPCRTSERPGSARAVGADTCDCVVKHAVVRAGRGGAGRGGAGRGGRGFACACACAGACLFSHERARLQLCGAHEPLGWTPSSSKLVISARPCFTTQFFLCPAPLHELECGWKPQSAPEPHLDEEAEIREVRKHHLKYE